MPNGTTIVNNYVNTLSAGDEINAGAGTDTLVVTSASALAVPATVTLTGIEAIRLKSAGTVTADTSGSNVTGTTSVSSSSIGGATLTASATQDVTATDSAFNTTTNGGVTITGGKNVTATLTAANATTDGDANAEIVVTGAVGTVNVTATGKYADGASNAMSNIAVTGGTTVNVTTKTGITAAQVTAALTDTDNSNGTITQSAVAVTGGAATTSVTVTQDAVVAVDQSDTAGKIGVTAGAVTIADANAGSATAAGTIATVTLTNFGASTIDSSALTTVNLSGTGGSLGIARGALTATPTANTLALNLNTAAVGTITDTEAGNDADDGFTTINLAVTGTSTINDLVAADAKTLNISGSGKVTFTANAAANGASNITTITSTNTGGVVLGQALHTGVLFTGGDGADEISIGQTTKAITLGGGNDVVTISNETLGAGGSVNGGSGTNTIVANTSGSSILANPAFAGFTTLRVAGLAAQGSHNAAGFTALEVGALMAADNDVTFTNVAAGVGLTQRATMTTGNDLTVTLANATGTADVFNLTLSSAGAIGADNETITLAGVETVNITSTDTDTTAHANSVELVATSAKTVNVSGNAGLNYRDANASITTFNASGVVLGKVTDTGITFDSTNTTVGEVVTITGSNGVDSLTGSATAKDIISGGDGVDTIVYDGGADEFTGGAGKDVFDVNAVGTALVHLTIKDLAVGDTIDLAGVVTHNTGAVTVGAKVSLGAAATFAQYLDAAAATAIADTTASLVKWFQFEGNTYLVVDNDVAGGGADTTTFGAEDAVVKMTGLIDLSTSTVTNTTNILTVVAV